MPSTVAAQSKAWTVFARSDAGIVGSNSTQGMDVFMRLFCICIVLCVGRGLATGWSTVQGVLPTVYRIKKLRKRTRRKEGPYSHNTTTTTTTTTTTNNNNNNILLIKADESKCTTNSDSAMKGKL
jgi:hypothetical protein